MAQLNGRPFPPGDYPIVVIGTGPGGLQVAATLQRIGVRHALLSEDEGPGGMFRRFPLFQRLITWTKPYAPHERRARAYEWHDWNSLLSAEPASRSLVAEEMDGTSYFPSRPEMEHGLAAFASAEDVTARYGCVWTGTAHREDGGFDVQTSDGMFSCRALVIAVGMTQPWRPDTIPGIQEVPHYVDVRGATEYAGRRVFIVGKRNSGFELADALLPWARSIVLGSPRPARLSVITRSTASARARYLQPWEDHVLGGGHLVLDVAIERIQRHADGYVVECSGTTRPGAFRFEVDEVIAATGFRAPLLDLPDLGVATFYGGRLPSQTPYWESTTVPGIFFAGSITQGAVGMKKHGNPSGSAAVHGFRYNARALAEHLAATYGSCKRPRPPVPPERVVALLLDEAQEAPELWHQQAYLARVVSFDPQPRDDGILPLEAFLDDGDTNAVAMTVETGPDGEIRPCAYIRRGGEIEELTLPDETIHDFRTAEHREMLGQALKGLI